MEYDNADPAKNYGKFYNFLCEAFPYFNPICNMNLKLITISLAKVFLQNREIISTNSWI